MTGAELIAWMCSYRVRLVRAGRLIEARAVQECIRRARTGAATKDRATGLGVGAP